MDTRYIDLEGTFNFRDIGGYQGANGKKVKMKKLYRADALTFLTADDVLKIKGLGIKTIIDYRGVDERKGAENQRIPETNTLYFDPVADIAALASEEFKGQLDVHDLSKLTGALVKDLMVNQNVAFVKDEKCQTAFKQMLETVLDEQNIPLVQHCRGGKDRTGFGVALILLLLGVSREDVMADYMLTNHYKKDKNEQSLKALFEKTQNADVVEGVRFFKEAQAEFLATALDLIEKDYGDVKNYVMTELGITAQQIDTLQHDYLED